MPGDYTWEVRPKGGLHTTCQYGKKCVHPSHGCGIWPLCEANGIFNDLSKGTFMFRPTRQISYYILLKCFAEIHFESLQCLLVQVTKSAAALCKTTPLVGCSLRGRTHCPYSITYSDGMYFTLNVPSGKAQQSRLLNHEWRYWSNCILKYTSCGQMRETNDIIGKAMKETSHANSWI